jgi:hypothetical protein
MYISCGECSRHGTRTLKADKCMPNILLPATSLFHVFAEFALTYIYPEVRSGVRTGSLHLADRS